jgi:periplasmic copper chaperone A
MLLAAAGGLVLTGMRRPAIASAGTAARGPSAPAAQVTVSDAWIPQPPPGSEVAAAYFTLRNGGREPATLVQISSPAASAAMLHESRVVAGESQMRPVDRLVIPPGGTVTLRPGGLHVMLHGLASALLPGQQVPLVLRFEGGREIRITARVRPLGGD